MTKRGMIILILTINIGYGKICAQETSIDLPVDVYMTQSMLGEMLADAKFINSFDYTLRDFLLLSTANQFYLLGKGGIKPFFASNIPIHSFTITPDGILLVVSNMELYQVDSIGVFKKILNLPITNMNISSGNDAIYLYGFDNTNNQYSAYMVSKNNTYKRLFTITEPIYSVFEYDSTLFVSSGNKIFCADILSRQIVQIVELADPKEHIISLALNPFEELLFFSTNRSIYVIRNNQISCVTDKLHGQLIYDEEGLLIFNSGQNYVIKLSNSMFLENNSSDNPKKENPLTTKTTIPLPSPTTAPVQSKPLTGQQKITFTETTPLLGASGEKFDAISGDTFEGEMKDGKVIQGKVVRNGETVKIFWDKRNF